MSALAEALLAAQRQAIGALSKAYVADAFDPDLAPATHLIETLNTLGCTDVVEQGHLLAALDVLRTYGAPAPATLREFAAEREYWQDVGLEHAERVTLETARWSQ